MYKLAFISGTQCQTFDKKWHLAIVLALNAVLLTKFTLNGDLLLSNIKAFAKYDAQLYKLALNNLEVKCSQIYIMRLTLSASLSSLNDITDTNK